MTGNAFGEHYRASMEGMKSVANGDGTTLKMDECCMLACFLRPGVISCDLAAALLADHPCTGCAYVCFFSYVVFTIVQLILYYLHVLQCDVWGSLNICWYIPKVAPVTGFTHEVIHCWGLLRKVRPFLLAYTCLSTHKQRISTLI